MAENEEQAGDEATAADDPAVTGICPHCGEEMVEEIADIAPTSHEQMAEHHMATVNMRFRCENVDCPGREVDMAKANPNGGS